MKKVRDILPVVLIVFAIVLTLDLLTNVLDTKNYAWDFVYYIALAKDGFDAQPLASPFAYRYLTPFIVNILSRVTGLSIDSGFLAVAWFGALTQLTGIFIFTNWLTKSRNVVPPISIAAPSTCFTAPTNASHWTSVTRPAWRVGRMRAMNNASFA